jgi:4-carboxymuconolactone decarboxylase
MIRSFLLLFTLTAAISSFAQTALDKKQQSIVTIAAFTANGETALLKKELDRGLDAGLTVNEIKEILYQLYAYAGFPRSLNAINTFQAVLRERQQKGINDAQGKESGPLPAGKTKYELGTENLARLTGASMAAGGEFAPTIEKFLKEHLFADIFGRDNLDWKTRELATVSALAGLGKAESQLRSHMGVGMRNGLTAEQLHEAVALITEKVGKTEGDSAAAVLQKVLGTNVTIPSAIRPAPNMTGNVFVQIMATGDSALNVSVANVSFAAGARSYWHSHEAGQILIVTQGRGYYQEEGKPSRLIKAGETIKCPANVSHWHGASSTAGMTHTSITSRTARVNWMQPVTEQEYNRAGL